MAETQSSKLKRLEKQILSLKLEMAEMKGELKVLREYRGHYRPYWSQPYFGAATTDRITYGPSTVLCTDKASLTNTSITGDPNPMWGGSYNST